MARQLESAAITRASMEMEIRELKELMTTEFEAAARTRASMEIVVNSIANHQVDDDHLHKRKTMQKVFYIFRNKHIVDLINRN